MENSRRTQFYRTPDILAIETTPRRRTARQRIGRAMRRIMETRFPAEKLRFLIPEVDDVPSRPFLDFLRKSAGQRVRIRYTFRGALLNDDIAYLDKVVTLPAVIGNRQKDEFIKSHLVYGDISTEDLIPAQDNFRGYLSITRSEAATEEFGQQTFQHGFTNCLLKHLQSWVDGLSTSTIKKASQKKMKSLWDKYKDGVPEECLQAIADTLSIGIKIISPYSHTILFDVKKESVIRTRRNFTFINTRENHVELMTNSETKNITQEEMNDLFELKSDGSIWKQSRDGTVFYMRDRENEYYVQDDESKEVTAFKTSFQGFDVLKNEELKSFIHHSILRMGTVDGKVNYSKKHTIHIDQKNSYASFKQCKYYSGFPAFITDNIQACNRIYGEGFYFVERFVCLGELAAVDKLLGGIFIDCNIYPANILKMLSSLGGEYVITSGCWGSTIDFDFPEEMITSKDYQKFIGILESTTRENVVRVHNVNFNWLSQVEHVVTRFGNVREILIPKNRVIYKGHLASYLIGYCACQTLTQLLTMDLDKIVRVCVDGIYTNQQDVKCTGSFRFKSEMKFGNAAGGKYFPLVHSPLTEEDRFLWDTRSSLFPHRISLAYGPGGAGKTYYLQNEDPGAVEVLFVNPSHELCAANPNYPSVTHEKLLTNEVSRDGVPAWVEIAKRYSEFVFDEASMLTKQQFEKIVERFPYHKLIFAGDLGYQLPPTDYNNTGVEELCEEDFEHKVEFKNDRRSHDKETKRFKKMARQLIDEGSGWKEILQLLVNSTSVKKAVKLSEWQNSELKKLKFEKSNDDVESVIRSFIGNDFGYKSNDMIICSEHKYCNEYTEYFKDKPKYKIKTNKKKYQNGNIVYEIPIDLNTTDYELRHGYTVHSSQGKTLKRRLFIDVRKIKTPRMLYTAISRVHKLSQIILINGI